MARKSRRSILTMLAASQVVGSGAGSASDDGSRDRTQARYFPNVELTTHEGKKVRFYDDLIKDKIVIINFMYAECKGICPGITANLLKVQKLLGNRIGRDIFMYSITLNPATLHILPHNSNSFSIFFVSLHCFSLRFQLGRSR